MNQFLLILDRALGMSAVLDLAGGSGPIFKRGIEIRYSDMWPIQDFYYRHVHSEHSHIRRVLVTYRKPSSGAPSIVKHPVDSTSLASACLVPTYSQYVIK